MTTKGEQFAQMLNTEAPDFCTRSCGNFGTYLLELVNQVNAGEIDPAIAQDPLIDLMRTCPRAVEAGGLSEGVAMEARSHLSSPDLRRSEQPSPPCVIDTFTTSHAEMYALGLDPYDGWLDE